VNKIVFICIQHSVHSRSENRPDPGNDDGNASAHGVNQDVDYRSSATQNPG